jgi:hypothetical protein
MGAANRRQDPMRLIDVANRIRLPRFVLTQAESGVYGDCGNSL